MKINQGIVVITSSVAVGRPSTLLNRGQSVGILEFWTAVVVGEVQGNDAALPQDSRHFAAQILAQLAVDARCANGP